MTWLLALAGLQFGYSVPAFGSQAAVLETLRGFFLEPFLDGHQYHLYLAAWFVLQLYLVHLVFQAVVWSPGRTAALATLAAAAGGERLSCGTACGAGARQPLGAALARKIGIPRLCA